MAGQEAAKGAGAAAAGASIRRATPGDAEACGVICFEAFRDIAAQHNFPFDFPGPEHAIGLLKMMFSHPGFYCVVAERDGAVIGSNCLDERGAIGGVGPITVAPAAQNRTTGRQLMHAVMARVAERRLGGVRLVQSAYHSRSLSLYAKLGFIVREPLACMQGPGLRRETRGYQVRPATPADLEACNELCRRVHGHDRGGELRDGIEHGTAVVAEGRGRITAYATSLAFFGHAVAETNEDLEALIAAAAEYRGSGILVPTRNAGLFAWCLANGLRVVQPLTLMTVGLYNEPAGAYLPSILY